MDKTKTNHNLKIDDEYEVLKNVQSSISKFDEKAGILVSVIGLIFGLSLFFIDSIKLISEDKNINNNLLLANKIIYIVYIVFGIMTILCCLFVFYPRKKEKNDKSLNVNYYYDLNKMKKEDYYKSLEEWKVDENLVYNQIKRNSKICYYKHVCLKCGIYGFIVYLILFLTLIIFNVFIF